MVFKPFLLAPVNRKVPHIITLFWIIKLLTTGMGEVFSDFLVKTIDPVIAVGIGFIGLVVALVVQIFMKKYNALIYWWTVTMVAIFGTMAADVLHVQFGIPYLVSSLFFAVSLSGVFAIWYGVEKTLSIHSIVTRRREILYWVTVLTTFALGTALGDMTATTLHLGYLDSGILFSALFAIPLLAWKLGWNEVIAFWCAYIITRPLGASFADWIGRPKDVQGLGFGTGQISLVLTILIVILVAYLSVTKKDILMAKS